MPRALQATAALGFCVCSRIPGSGGEDQILWTRRASARGCLSPGTGFSRRLAFTVCGDRTRLSCVAAFALGDAAGVELDAARACLVRDATALLFLSSIGESNDT